MLGGSPLFLGSDMGDPVYRKKPQLHYAVSVPAQKCDRGRHLAGLGGDSSFLVGSMAPYRSSVVSGGVEGAACVAPCHVNCPETQLPLRRGAPNSGA